MRVLLIGTAGYIGQRMVRQMRERGGEVTTADVRPGEGVDEVVDMRSGGEVYRLLLRHRPEVIVVTAYMLSAPTAANPVRGVETNVLGVTNIFQAAADLQVRRVVFASSGGIFGRSEDFPVQPVDESVVCRPRSLYGKMKQFNEWTADHFNSAGGTEIVSFRISGPHGVSGPHGGTKNTGGASAGGSSPYDMVIEAAGNATEITLPWRRDTSFRFIHVEDAAAAFGPLVFEVDLRHRVYNAPGFVVSMAELAEISEPLCRLHIAFADPGRTIDHVIRIDSTRYESEFSFRPRSLGEWMQEEVSTKRARGGG